MKIIAYRRPHELHRTKYVPFENISTDGESIGSSKQNESTANRNTGNNNFRHQQNDR